MERQDGTPSNERAWEVALVTGIGSGIGFAAAVALARKGTAIVGVVRNDRRAEETWTALEREVPGVGARLAFVAGDLAKRRDVERMAEEIGGILDARFGGCLDRLVYSAGQVTGWYLATEDGYETQFAVNHLAAFQLGLRLRDRLEASGDGRLIVVSSGSHYRTRMRWNDLMMRRLYDPLSAYKQSKLANVLFVHGYNARFASDRLRAYAVDPGLVDTGIGEKGTSGLVRWVWRLRRKGGASPEAGAATIVALSLAADAPKGACDYYKDGAPVRPSAYSMRKDAVDRLWAVSERLCGLEGSAV
jgi:NAD(P)-dependent dehydrogenase (short-subunit alcohol dehydrogenase family)